MREIDRIEKRLKKMFSPKVRIGDAGSHLRVGQMWTPAGPSPDRSQQPSWQMLLVEQLDGGLFNAVPVFRWTELAGPQHVLLSRKLAGVRLAAALGLETTVERSMLLECEGCFPEAVVNYVLSARAAVDDPVERNQFRWGLDYYGPHDYRLTYGERIAERLEVLQAGVRDQVWRAEI